MANTMNDHVAPRVLVLKRPEVDLAVLRVEVEDRVLRAVAVAVGEGVGGVVDALQGHLQQATLRLVVVGALGVDIEQRCQTALAGRDERGVVTCGDTVERLDVDGGDFELSAAVEEASDPVVGAQPHVDRLRDVVVVGVELETRARSSPTPSYRRVLMPVVLPTE